MEKFKISDIQEIFAGDLQKFRDETRGHLGLLIARATDARKSLDEAIRYAHALKGLSATVEAWGLANWGGDLETLLELSGTFLEREPARAEEIYRFIMEHMDPWSAMNGFTLAEQFEPAWDLYQALRMVMEQRWPGYLQPPVTAIEPAAPPTRQPDPAPVAAAQPGSPAPTGPAAPTPVSLAPPPFRRRGSDAQPPVTDSFAAEAPVQEASPATAGPVPARPTPLALQPPMLRRAATSQAAEAEPSLESAATVPTPPAAPARPSPAPAASVPTSPRPHLAQPVFLRRANQTEATGQPEPVSTSGTVEAVVTTPAREAPLSAETSAPVESALFSPPLHPAAQNASEPPAPEPASVGFAPERDSDLLAMLGQEISGYLNELTETLRMLLADLPNLELWDKSRRLFHTIKGTAATFQLDGLSAPAKAAEARCLVAAEDVHARTFETVEACLERAAGVAAALHLDFPREDLAFAVEEAKARPASAPKGSDSDDAALDAEMAGFFIRDARDQIETIEQAILRWEKGEHPAEQVWAAQRGFHTLKGAASSIGLSRVARSVHEAEGFLEGVATDGAQGSPALFSFLLGAVDQLRAYAKELSTNPRACWLHDWAEALRVFRPSSAASGKTSTAEFAPIQEVVQPHIPGSDANEAESHTLRIDASRLHALMNLIGEAVIDRSRLEKKIELLTRLHRELGERNAALTASVQTFQQQFEFNLLQDRAQQAPGPLPGSGRLTPSPDTGSEGSQAESEFSELEFDRYDQFSILARSLLEISHDVAEVSEEMSECLDSFSVENTRFRETSRHLQDTVTSLSLLPVSTLFPRLERAFRDAVQVEGKEAGLELEGGSALLDKVVIDRVFAPLMHLLRNAVAHGIEDPATRERLKKPARGQVRVSTTQLSNQIVIHIRDDGSGVRTDAVRQRAIEKGWLPAEAPPLTPDQVVHYIFQPGFSTASKITSVSGRGVGLDVVRKEIESLNGSVELQFEPGAGSTWTLRLPLTLSISEAILAESGGVTFAFPINFIESGLIIETTGLQQEAGRNTCPVGEGRLPVTNLSELLALPGESTSSSGLIISAGDRRAIVVVDRVLRRQEIVVKQLDSLFARHPLLNGATLDADGKVIPILNLPSLLKYGERASNRRGRRDQRIETLEEHRQLRVLIADDSLSVRKVQERLLADLGCHVTSASDGLSALEKLREGKFDFLFTDLEMPRINGYELISEVRGHPAWASLPIVVISSRGADKYITKAMNLGANSFLSKPFTRQQLQQVLQFYAGWDAKNRIQGSPTAALREAV